MQLALLLVLAAAPASQSWQFETQGTPAIKVLNVEGSVSVQATEGKSVQVEVTQEGSEAERARYPVRVVQEGEQITAQVCCDDACENGEMKKCRSPVPTRFVLRVPRGSSLETAVVNAEVKVSGVEGAQELASVNGRLEIKGSKGKVEAATVGGSVVLEPQVLADTEVATVSGDVKVKLPPGAGANVSFSSVSGRFNGRTILLGGSEQKIGAGGPEVEVATVSGSLEVQPAK